MAATELKADCLILGGGIAGLWCLDAAVQAGHQAALFSDGPLAVGQTLASQGIIHGGTKYTLDMQLSAASEAIAAMPARWRACLAGSGENDLSQVPILAQRHMMWLPPQFAAGMMRFFASKALRGRTETLAPADYPALFADPAFQGSVLALDEVVLDVPALVAVLAARHHQRIFDSARFTDLNWQVYGASATASFQHNGTPYHLTCDHLVGAAGAGNQTLAKVLGMPQVATQRRPLRMVMLRQAPSDLWAHCVVKQINPRFTITSHQAADGARIWYIGGDIAERGATLSPLETIDLARQELSTLLPWLDLTDCQWSTLLVDRAEAKQTGSARPDSPVLYSQGPVHLAWPTKLAFAPLLADQVLAKIGKPGSDAAMPDALDPGFAAFDQPKIGTPAWDEVDAWN
jgi:glycerol-3-phosphate dehydrogenase